MSSASTSVVSSTITSVVLRHMSSRAGVAVVTGLIFTMAGAAVHVALDRDRERAAPPDRVTLAAWSRALARADAEARIDPARVARLRPAALAAVPPADTCTIARATGSPIVDIARRGPQRVATRTTADAFNAALIANFLQTPRVHRRPRIAAAHAHIVRVALNVTQLDIAGIAEPEGEKHTMEAPPAPVPAESTVRNASRPTANAWGFGSGVGQVSAGARAGTLNGAPAAALDVGITENGVRFNAAGMSEVSSFDSMSLRHGFKAMTGASIPLD